MLRGNSCEIMCNYDEYFDIFESKCKNCGRNCLTCFSANNCISCNDPIEYKVDNGICIKRCPEGKYVSISYEKKWDYFF